MDQEEGKNDIILFPYLQYLKMEDLEMLTSFYKGDSHIEFPALKQLEIVRYQDFTLDLRKQVRIRL